MAVKTLFLVSSILAASAPCAAAVELLNPHDVLNKTRRDMNAFDQRMKGYKAEQQKKEKEAEAKRKQEDAERHKREKAEKAVQEAQRKREAAEQRRREREARLSIRLRRSKVQPQSPPKGLRPCKFRLLRLSPRLGYRNRVRQVSPETHHSSAEASG